MTRKPEIFYYSKIYKLKPLFWLDESQEKTARSVKLSIKLKGHQRENVDRHSERQTDSRMKWTDFRIQWLRTKQTPSTHINWQMGKKG